MSSLADVLFVTVNEHETNALIDVLEQATGEASKRVTIDRRTYRKFGTLNQTRIYHAESEMGSSGPGATQQTVELAIRAIHPGAIVLVGIAFGVNEQKQAIGDILISQQLNLYELRRAGAEIIPRGDKPHASSRLINFFLGAKTSWRGPHVTPGVVLSGDKLVDNIDYRDQLLGFEKEAIGGEMEGAGVYVSSNEHKVDWIVIKAICDWGDGHKAKNKTARQKKAAKAAVQFVLHALQDAQLVSSDAQFETANQTREQDERAIDVKDILVGMQGSSTGPVTVLSHWVMPMYDGIAESLRNAGMGQVIESPTEIPLHYLDQYSDSIVAAPYFALNAAVNRPTTKAVVSLFNEHIRPPVANMLTGWLSDRNRRPQTIRVILGFYYAYDRVTIAVELLISSAGEVGSALDLVPEAQLQALEWTIGHGINTPQLTFRIHDSHLVKFPTVAIPPATIERPTGRHR
jgi:nucleoside phosphorylase